MPFSAIVRTLSRSPLAGELLNKLNRQQHLQLEGVPRFPKGLVASALAQKQPRNLCVVAATLEEAGRWAAQLEAMGWDTVHFYPTSEASPYEPTYSDEMTWGQMQVLADLVGEKGGNRAIVAQARSLQPHLPPRDAFQPHCIELKKGMEWEAKTLDRTLAQLGYDRVNLVETEGQWSRRGDIVDIFPVSAELPVRLEWFGDELDSIREFDSATQRSLDRVEGVVLTPTGFGNIIAEAIAARGGDIEWAQSDGFDGEKSINYNLLLGMAFENPASLLDYLSDETLVVVDEPEQCRAHGDPWYDRAEEHWQQIRSQHPNVAQLHCSFDECLQRISNFDRLDLSELENAKEKATNLASRAVPVVPHQFAKIAEAVRGEVKKGFSVFLISAQPSRAVSLLQEHDCPAQFIKNDGDFSGIDRALTQHTPVALKYSGQAEVEGFILPTFRMAIVTDREFFGQHSLATPSYIRKRRRAASKQVDPNKLRPGDYVVHKHHGIGQFIKLESLTIDYETREYLVLKYADGILRVAADRLGELSRYRRSERSKPQLNKLSGKSWEKAKNKVRKAVKKLAVDLLKLYAKRAKQTGFSYGEDTPWQQELEDSFPYQPTPDQLKAIQDMKRDMESDRPMDRLVCGDVGFGKTEVAVRGIFKAVMAGKQVAMLAPTTILTQQHYHTLKERFAPYPIQIGLLNRFRSLQERKDIQKRLATGELDVVVGTHQLLGKEVEFKDLGLLVVDEEQRFGVNHKEKIKDLKSHVDVLTLTATPIPRTLYMSLSGVREMSLIATPPPSRRPIKTNLSAYDLEIIRSAICQELDRGGQVFYVVPRVEGIEETSAKIREMVPNARLLVAHGQLDSAELESVTIAFSNGEADVLVCTTIIESGLDIPRVNTILIEDAQKFGLSQLYQLRGRVGRSGIQAYAWLFYPSQQQLSDIARKRLRALQEFSQLGSGYQLAMRDMEIRGVGNLLGAEQSGHLTAIGFDLYMDMLDECLREIQGQDIPKVDDTQIDLNMTAFIPTDYIPDLEQKMSAYREVAAAKSPEELRRIAEEWSDRYGPVPTGAAQLLQVMELKQIAKSIGFSRIKPQGQQHVILETPMEEPAWNLLKEGLPESLQSRFMYAPGKVLVRGLGVVKADKQLGNLIDWLGKMQKAIGNNEIADPS